MAAKALVRSSLALRIFALLFLIGSLVVLLTNNFTFGDHAHDITFKDIATYRYVFSAAAIGVSFALLQIPFSIYHVCMAKRMNLPDFLLNFDFYADKVISNLLAAGVGAGFAYGMELKKFLSRLLDSLIIFGVPEADKMKSDATKFLDKGNFATSLLLVGFVCMAVLSIISPAKRTKDTRGFVQGNY